MMLKGMRVPMVRQLLRVLLLKQSLGVPRPRCVFVHAQFGLGNRLRSLGSAMAFASETGRVPVVIWVADHHLNCHYSDLFLENDGLVVNDNFDEEVGGEWPWEEERARDPNASKMKFYNYMKQNGHHIHEPSVAVIDDKEAHIFIKSAYVIQSPSTPSIMHTHSPFWRVLSRSLTPNIVVARLIESQAQMPTDNLMGIHIRSKRIETDIEGVGVEEYSKESSKRTDYWRNLTQVDTFVQEMARQPRDQLFYVAADDALVLPALQQVFPSRIYCTPRRCDGRDTECLPYALADILILARCKTIRGSYWSSFSEMAVRIGGGRVFLAGIDFGRPRKRRIESAREKAISVLKLRRKAYRRKQIAALKMSKEYQLDPRNATAMFYQNLREQAIAEFAAIPVTADVPAAVGGGNVTRNATSAFENDDSASGVGHVAPPGDDSRVPNVGVGDDSARAERVIPAAVLADDRNESGRSESDSSGADASANAFEKQEEPLTEAPKRRPELEKGGPTKERAVARTDAIAFEKQGEPLTEAPKRPLELEKDEPSKERAAAPTAAGGESGRRDTGVAIVL